jgi:hypothetical protein
LNIQHHHLLSDFVSHKIPKVKVYLQPTPKPALNQSQPVFHTMPPLSIFESVSNRNRSCNDVSSSNSTFSVLGNAKRPLSPPIVASSRAVTFAPEAKVFPTLNRSEYTAEEKSTCWLNQEDYKALKVERKVTLKIMERSEPFVNDGERKVTLKIMERSEPFVNDGQHYFRGLESKTREGSRRKQFNVVDASMAVFEEQMQQECDGVCDAEAIAQVYIDSARHCISAAHERGLVDQNAALESVCVSVPALSQRQPRRLSCHAA